MQLGSVPTLSDLTRQERLDIWMRRGGVTFVRLGEICGVHANCAAKLLRQETLPVRHHAALLAAGVPLELLPEALDQKPGPKPKSERTGDGPECSPGSHAVQDSRAVA